MGLINHTYKLLVVDIDGTLIGEDGTIPAENRDALAKVRRSGIQVSLSTGRVAKTCVEIIDQLSLEGNHIFFDGALVSNPEKGEEICVKPISEELVRRAVEFARLNEINLDLFSATHYFIERETWASEIRRKFFGIPPWKAGRCHWLRLLRL